MRPRRLVYRLVTVVLTGLLSWPSLAAAVSFNHVISLGDSTLDAGAARSPVVSEHIANQLGVPHTKFAMGGARTQSLLDNQQHTDAADAFGPGDLAVVWIGGNDFLDASLDILLSDYAFMDVAEANVETVLSTLRGDGMDVLLLGLPDFSVLPAVRGLAPESLFPVFRAASAEWTSRLSVLAGDYGALFLDLFAFYDELVADPSAFALFGIEPVLAPTTGCQFCVWFDSIHPSAPAQGFLANLAIEQMNAFYDPTGSMPIEMLSNAELGALAGLPEPNIGLLILAGSLLGVLRAVRRRP